MEAILSFNRRQTTHKHYTDMLFNVTLILTRWPWLLYELQSMI